MGVIDAAHHAHDQDAHLVQDGHRDRRRGGVELAEIGDGRLVLRRPPGVECDPPDVPSSRRRGAGVGR